MGLFPDESEAWGIPEDSEDFDYVARMAKRHLMPQPNLLHQLISYDYDEGNNKCIFNFKP